MLAVLGFLKSPLGRYGLIALGVLLILAAWRVDHAAQVRKLERCEAMNARLVADYRTAKRNADALQSALDDQNAAVDKLASDAKAREAKAQAAVREAQRGREAAEARARKLLAAKPGPDQCASADKLILEAVK